MRFDARAAKLLQPGEHIMVDGCPGLRLVATAAKRTWTYRFKSPVDGRMRQIAIGQWPAKGPAAAALAWEELRAQRDAGADPALQKRQARVAIAAPARDGYTIRDLVDDYLAGHVDVHRKAKGAAELRRIFDKQLGDLASAQAYALTRSQAFDFLEQRAGTPVQTAAMRQELGAAWDYALDAGRLPETAPNWWPLIMRGGCAARAAFHKASTWARSSACCLRLRWASSSGGCRTSPGSPTML